MDGGGGGGGGGGSSGGGGGGKKRKITGKQQGGGDVQPEYSSITVLGFNALMVYEIGYLEPNAMHGSIPRVFNNYTETVAAHGAQQLQDTRSTLFHLDYQRGDTFRIMFAWTNTPSTHILWGRGPPQYLVRTLTSLKPALMTTPS